MWGKPPDYMDLLEAYWRNRRRQDAACKQFCDRDGPWTPEEGRLFDSFQTDELLSNRPAVCRGTVVEVEPYAYGLGRIVVRMRPTNEPNINRDVNIYANEWKHGMSGVTYLQEKQVGQRVAVPGIARSAHEFLLKPSLFATIRNYVSS